MQRIFKKYRCVIFKKRNRPPLYYKIRDLKLKLKNPYRRRDLIFQGIDVLRKNLRHQKCLKIDDVGPFFAKFSPAALFFFENFRACGSFFQKGSYITGDLCISLKNTYRQRDLIFQGDLTFPGDLIL